MTATVDRSNRLMTSEAMLSSAVNRAFKPDTADLADQ